MQTKLESLFENVINVVSGLALSIWVVQPIAFKYYNIHTTMSQNIQLAIVFTLVSIARGYLFRRLFNMRAIKKLAVKGE